MRDENDILGIRKMTEEEMREEVKEEEMKEEIEEEEEEEEQTKPYIDKLIEKVIKEGKEETKYVLELDEWVTLGSAVSTWSTITILYGEVEKILTNTKYDYFMSITKTYSIIPKTELVILAYTSVSDFGGQLQYHTVLYVFFKSTGWKSITVS